MYPLDLYTTLKSKPRNTSRREGLAEFGPIATLIREVKLEILTEISEADFMTFSSDPWKFQMKPAYAVILGRGTR